MNGLVIMYADKITESMKKTIDETERRRSIQLKYNEEHHITPQQIVKEINGALTIGRKIGSNTAAYPDSTYLENNTAAFAADPIIQKMKFLQAAQYRDEIIRLQAQLDLK